MVRLIMMISWVSLTEAIRPPLDHGSQRTGKRFEDFFRLFCRRFFTPFANADLTYPGNAKGRPEGRPSKTMVFSSEEDDHLAVVVMVAVVIVVPPPPGLAVMIVVMMIVVVMVVVAMCRGRLDRGGQRAGGDEDGDEAGRKGTLQHDDLLILDRGDHSPLGRSVVAKR